MDRQHRGTGDSSGGTTRRGYLALAGSALIAGCPSDDSAAIGAESTVSTSSPDRRLGEPTVDFRGCRRVVVEAPTYEQVTLVRADGSPRDWAGGYSGRREFALDEGERIGEVVVFVDGRGYSFDSPGRCGSTARPQSTPEQTAEPTRVPRDPDLATAADHVDDALVSYVAAADVPEAGFHDVDARWSVATVPIRNALRAARDALDAAEDGDLTDGQRRRARRLGQAVSVFWWLPAVNEDLFAARGAVEAGWQSAMAGDETRTEVRFDRAAARAATATEGPLTRIERTASPAAFEPVERLGPADYERKLASLRRHRDHVVELSDPVERYAAAADRLDSGIDLYERHVYERADSVLASVVEPFEGVADDVATVDWSPPFAPIADDVDCLAAAMADGAETLASAAAADSRAARNRRESRAREHFERCDLAVGRADRLPTVT